jgi:hypothetical protein
MDVRTLKKLILIKQIYQRALIQSQSTHRIVDRMLAVVGFDFANETTLKTVAVALNPTIQLERPFPKVRTQVESELKKQNKNLLDTIKIQDVHDVRNATQHQARYPNKIEVSDSRTYTRDFLTQAFTEIWETSFESLSLVDEIQSSSVKNHLLEAEQNLAKEDYSGTFVKSIIAFNVMTVGLANWLTENIGSSVNGIVVTKSFRKQESSDELLKAFIKTRELVVLQTIGINPQEYLKYKKVTRFVLFDDAGSNFPNFEFKSEKEFTPENAEYVFNFVTNSIVQIESLGNDFFKFMSE